MDPNISSVPFKVNKELLDFLNNNRNVNLLLDPFKKHEYSDIKRLKFKRKNIELIIVK
jgi:hypothetical protein